MANIIKILRNKTGEASQLVAGEPALYDPDDGSGQLFIGNIAENDNILIGASNVARLSGATFTGTITLTPGSQTTDNHAATIAYCDNLATGTREIKDSVALATTGALAAYTFGSAKLTANAVGALEVDANNPVAGERVLVKDETGGNAKYNGIYEVEVAGNGGTAWVIKRAADSDTAEENSQGQFCFVDYGTANAATGWLQNSADCATINVSDITFTKVSGTALVLADETTVHKATNTLSVKSGGITGTQFSSTAVGNGLTGGSGSAISVNVDNATLALSGDDVVIKAQGVDADALNTNIKGNGFTTGGGGSALAVGQGTGVTVNADDVSLNFGSTTGTAIEGGSTIDGGSWTAV
jgi:hypothetical protein